MDPSRRRIPFSRRAGALLSRYASGSVFVLLLAACILLSVQLHSWMRLSAQRASVTDALQDLQDRLLEAGRGCDADASSPPPPGLMYRLDHREDISGFCARLERQLKSDPAARDDLHSLRA